MAGWIKLHRQLRNSRVYKNPELLQLWIELLLRATHREHRQIVGNQEVVLKPGQMIFGRKELASELKMSESKVYRLLKILQEIEKNLVVESNNKFSVGTIVEWEKYQLDEQQTEQQMNNKRTTNEQQMNTNKNVKNGKNEKKKTSVEFTDEFELFWKEYPRKKEKPGAFKCWNTRLKEKYTPEDLILAAKNYAKQTIGTAQNYIKLPSTFLGPSKPFEDYLRVEVEQKIEKVLTEEEKRMEEKFKKWSDAG